MKKLLVIDGNSILNRAFYGIRLLSTAEGKYTNAIYGMVNIAIRNIEEFNPDYAAVAFDLKAPTFRKQIYDEYKAKRHETPAELLSQFDDAKACLSAMGFNILELAGYEADDLIGTAASLVHTSDDVKAYVLSGDRDLLQLIDDKITVLLAGNNDTVKFDTERFKEKYGVLPQYLVDIKSLMGDPSDNIPGVAGVGEKTALKLICEFGTLKGVYENIDSKSISASLREKLLVNRENAEMSYKLAKIETQSPVPRTLEEIKRKPVDKTRLFQLFKSLEFNAFIKRFSLTDSGAEDKPTSAPSDIQITDVDAPAFIRALGNRFAIEYDEESGSFTGCGESDESRSDDQGSNYGKDRESKNGKKINIYKFSGNPKDIAELFDGKKTVICYDSKSLYHALSRGGVELHGIPRDLMLYTYVLNSSDGAMTLERASLSYLGNSLPPNGSTEVMLKLEKLLYEKINKCGCEQLLLEIELPTAITLAKIEQAGFRIDLEGMEKFGKELSEGAKIAEERIYILAGREFNINSPKQLGEILFDTLALPGGKKTKSGYSTAAEVLEKLRASHPIIEEILEYRQLTKLYSTYAVGLLKAADKDGRIHTDFRQALTATGRLSSTEPNLQNIPIRTALGRRIRKYFIPAEGCVLIDSDYSQIELRLLAHISGDENMIHAFKEGDDIHAKTASVVFGVSRDAVSDELRKRAKAVNFGIVYGIGDFSLAQDLKISRREAAEYIRSYLESYPKIDAYLKKVVEDAYVNGYVTTLFGRRRYIPELKSNNKNLRSFGERVAMNSPIQGSAADIMKLAMVNVANALKKEGLSARVVMQVHDELVVEVKREDSARAEEIVRLGMEGAVSLDVPLTAHANVSDNWYE